MALLTHVAPHPHQLVAALCRQLADPIADPFAPELVCVPSRGIERWLTQQIASSLADLGRGDGICANVRFPSPRRLVGSVLAAMPGLAEAEAAWEGPAAVAHVLTALDESVSEPALDVLARHLAPRDGVAASRLAAASKIAGNFRRYARRRPAMIRAWAGGEDVGPDGRPLPLSDLWQPLLWRAVCEEAGVLPAAAQIPEALAPIRDDPTLVDVPDRLAVYGLTSTDPVDLMVLEALSERRDIHLYVLHPSPASWERLRPEARASLPVRSLRAASRLVTHPLLATWGIESRELQQVLATHGVDVAPEPSTHGATGSLLGFLQADIAGDRPPSRVRPEPADRSVQIHVCHGPRRQVEVLRDAICHVLASDPTLEPRDVVIMTPDLATFAPLIEAAFVPGGNGGVPDLRVRIADRSPAATNPLVRFAANILEVAAGRLEASVVRELVTRPVVQQRFGFDLAGAGDIVTLVEDSNVSWGADAGHRAEWGVGEIPERTWADGLDRVLTGAFYSDDRTRLVGNVAPLEGVEGSVTHTAGLLARIVERLVAVRDLLAEPLPLSQWAPAVSSAVRLLAAPAWGEEWQLLQLDRLLTETFPAPDQGADPPVSLADARRAIAAWSDDRPSPLHFNSGDVTVCTLVPMRSVPYRVVCLLGLDDDRFPRSSRVDGDDLLAEHEIVGDFDRGAQDRQLLLDAVMAAGDHLIVTYSGNDELTSTSYPPSVPIAELMDVIGEMVGDHDLVVTRHPLQAFSARNFSAGELGVAGAWGFDRSHLAGAAAIAGPEVTTAPTPVDWPPVVLDDVLQLTDLHAFLADPIGRFLRSRLGFAVPEAGELADDTIPTSLSGLGQWGATNRVLLGLLAGHDLDLLVRRESRGGSLPPGNLSSGPLEVVVKSATSLHRAAADRGLDPAALRPLSGRVMSGEYAVEGAVEVDESQGRLAWVTPSRVRAATRLRMFVELVFATAVRPDVAWTGVLLGRRPQGHGQLVVEMGPIKAAGGLSREEVASQLLSGLVELYVEGSRRPLPLPCETGYTWQREVASNRGRAFGRAAEAWSGRFGEARSGSVAMVLGDIADIRALLATDFEELCARLWLPIIALTVERRI